MGYPENLRNYQGPWPPPRDFLLSPEDAAFMNPTRRFWSRPLARIMAAAAVAGLVLPDTNYQHIPILDAIIAGLGLVFPVIRAMALFSHNALGDVVGVSILIVGMMLAVVLPLWRSLRRVYAIFHYSPLVQYIRSGYPIWTRSGYLATSIFFWLVTLALAIAWVMSDIQGYIALYTHHVALRAVATNPFAFGLLSGNGLAANHLAYPDSLFWTLRQRFRFPIFIAIYGVSLFIYILLIMIPILTWTHARTVLKATREDLRILKNVQLKRRAARKNN
ncbi:hypothetical protein [Acidiferrobacter sp.]|uniref:hypothetical protein n=1 Tax=Acidiferrobacter sp. TaxID=1872107 RepID=UPI0026194634|nr:hypothetical protein [Acidiferrobacter sp.]